MDEKSTIVPLAAPSTGSSADAEVTRLTLTLRHQSAEIQDLNRRLEELDEIMQQRTRRVSQLIGERDQLATLLAKRDEESRQLNRELGAQLGTSTPRPSAGAWSWLARLEGVLAPLWARDQNAGKDRTASTAAVDDATATTELPLIPKIKDQPPRPMLGVAIFGLAAPELNGVLQIVDDFSRQHGFEPLLLTDSDAFEHFRARRLVFEYLPPADSEMLGPELDWQLYTQRRLALIRRKWQPVRVISFGRKAADIVELWRQSPFEADPLPTAVGSLGRAEKTVDRCREAPVRLPRARQANLNMEMQTTSIANEKIAAFWSARQKDYVAARELRTSEIAPGGSLKLCRELICDWFGEIEQDSRASALGFARWLAEAESSTPVTLVAAAVISLESQEWRLAAKLADRAMDIDHRDILAQRISRAATEETVVMALEVDTWLRDRFCSNPFSEIETRASGDVLTCCSAWLPVPIGRFDGDGPNNFWNSPHAQEIRRSIHDGDFSYCSRVHCPKIAARQLPRRDEVADPEFRAIIDGKVTKLAKAPRRVLLSHDRSCNLSCPSCRTEKILLNHPASDALDRVFDEKLLPIIKQAKQIKITGSGDPFGSRHFRHVLKRLTRTASSARRLQLHTNGVLCDRRAWSDLGLEGHVDTIWISIDAAKESTYRILRRGGAMPQLLENLRFLCDLRKEGAFNFLRLDFVVQMLNYREMPDLVRLAKDYGVDGIYFLLLRNWGTFSEREFRKHNIADTSHPEHEMFLEVLRNPILNDKIVEFGTLSPIYHEANS